MPFQKCYKKLDRVMDNDIEQEYYIHMGCWINHI